MTTNPEAAAAPAEITIARVFDAPRDLVWNVWTDPEHAKQWWGPDNCTTTVFERDLRPGGAIAIDMRGGDGNIVRVTGTYAEVVVPERLVSVAHMETAGEIAFQSRMTVTFEELDGKTTVTVHQAYSKTTSTFRGTEGARVGWSQAFGKLEAYLGSLSGDTN